MYQRNRSQNHSQDWDPMREEYENSTYAPQYHDDDTNTDGGVQLDHCKLYVTNIPKTLKQEGLRNLFSKYGNCLKIFLSNDPSKRYALIWYETPSEAKLAMMKLNKTDPLQLNINVAHKKTYQEPQNQRSSNNQRSSMNYRDDGSVSSKSRYSRKLEEVSNGENNNDDDIVIDDDLGLLDDGLDTNLVLEIEELKLKHLKLQEAQIQCKQRMLLLNRIGKNTAQKPAVNRCMLPDGRIVVRNTNERTEQQDVAFSSAAGDSLTLPALQRVSSRACLACGQPADSYCARCGLAPYCGLRCQTVDWVRRHRSVCHNLARLNESTDNTNDAEVAPAVTPAVQTSLVPQAPPLRRPHSPAQTVHARRQEKREDTNTNDRQNRNSGQNKSYRGNTSFKNRNLRRPMQQNTNNATVPDEEESFEPKEPTKKTEPKQPSPVKSAAAKEQPKLPVHKKPAAVEPEVPKSNKEQEVKTSTKALTVNDTTPIRKLVPKNYVVETLSIGDTVLLSVDAKAADCKSKTDGYICLSLHETSERDYQLLCGDYSADCEAETTLYKPNPGEVFSYCNPEDGAWYRAKLLNAAQAALIDSSKLVTISPSDKCQKMTPKYENIPEFCCALDARNLEIGNSLKCTLISKTEDGFKVELENAETGTSVGEGVVSRWKPQVDYVVPSNGTPAVVIPAVKRPDLINNSSVLLVEATAMDSIFVRPSDKDSLRKYDGILQDVLHYGMTAIPIENPPLKGQVVIGKFTDGNCYRALCKRTNVNQNKYLLEYIEFGNTEINTKETIYACPPELNLESQPTVVSLAKLRVGVSGLTAAGAEFLENVKDTAADLTLTLADGSKSAPSGAEVNLVVSKSKESINKKLEELCTPEWKKIENSGGDVIQSPTLTFSDLEHLDLPEEGCVLDILDISVLSFGSVNACLKDLPYAKEVFTTLTEQMAEYCNSEIGREPYLPNLEELCIAQCPPYPQWFRGVLCERVSGPGGARVRVCYVDYGNMQDVCVQQLRKMMPDFVRDRPALATHVELRGFPENPTEEMLAKALVHMKVNDEGRGELKVTRCERIEPGLYIVDAPDLLRAMGV
ncbi:uncharacterized protein LOC125075261 isoform X3 [Vanessa atalanta]|uniref:uncharacterized protein LOC125075261 isoform X3 n=1 Tax=Vanessa atalanta TaxID=42275 RepID=UPI001FCD4C6C|nr:uncharacterized protein LOC125075261 isoform X3 [Vanessa atalanta]